MDRWLPLTPSGIITVAADSDRVSASCHSGVADGDCITVIGCCSFTYRNRTKSVGHCEVTQSRRTLCICFRTPAVGGRTRAGCQCLAADHGGRWAIRRRRAAGCTVAIATDGNRVAAISLSTGAGCDGVAADRVAGVTQSKRLEAACHCVGTDSRGGTARSFTDVTDSHGESIRCAGEATNCGRLITGCTCECADCGCFQSSCVRSVTHSDRTITSSNCVCTVGSSSTARCSRDVTRRNSECARCVRSTAYCDSMRARRCSIPAEGNSTQSRSIGANTVAVYVRTDCDSEIAAGICPRCDSRRVQAIGARPVTDCSSTIGSCASSRTQCDSAATGRGRDEADADCELFRSGRRIANCNRTDARSDCLVTERRSIHAGKCRRTDSRTVKIGRGSDADSSAGSTEAVRTEADSGRCAIRVGESAASERGQIGRSSAAIRVASRNGIVTVGVQKTFSCRCRRCGQGHGGKCHTRCGKGETSPLDHCLTHNIPSFFEV